jgi:hypothetical protein
MKRSKQSGSVAQKQLRKLLIIINNRHTFCSRYKRVRLLREGVGERFDLRRHPNAVYRPRLDGRKRQAQGALRGLTLIASRMLLSAIEGNGPRRLFHVSSQQNIMELRDEILRAHGFFVQSTVYSAKVIDEIVRVTYDLVLVDVESDVRVKSAQDLCETIKKAAPGQHVAFVCNHRVSIESDCPDEIIRAEFNPEALVRGVQETLEKNDHKDRAL